MNLVSMLPFLTTPISHTLILLLAILFFCVCCVVLPIEALAAMHPELLTDGRPSAMGEGENGLSLLGSEARRKDDLVDPAEIQNIV